MSTSNLSNVVNNVYIRMDRLLIICVLWLLLLLIIKVGLFGGGPRLLSCLRGIGLFTIQFVLLSQSNLVRS